MNLWNQQLDILSAANWAKAHTGSPLAVPPTYWGGEWTESPKNTGNIFPESGFWLSIWVKAWPNERGEAVSMVLAKSTAGGGFTLDFNPATSANIRWSVRKNPPTGGWTQLSAAIPMNTWVHVLCGYDGANTFMSIDGTKQSVPGAYAENVSPRFVIGVEKGNFDYWLYGETRALIAGTTPLTSADEAWLKNNFDPETLSTEIAAKATHWWDLSRTGGQDMIGSFHMETRRELPNES